jgi:hypothetical protein
MAQPGNGPRSDLHRAVDFPEPLETQTYRGNDVNAVTIPNGVRPARGRACAWLVRGELEFNSNAQLTEKPAGLGCKSEIIHLVAGNRHQEADLASFRPDTTQ